MVRPLFEGPVDIVGDVHGEIDLLRSLLGHLGYSADGFHPEGRRLVLVGDLTDRGPDSPAVVELVQQFVLARRAQCVLGNHDLNLLLNHPKHDNGWFYGEEFHSQGQVIPQKLADLETRQRVLDFFASLPLALERADLRVVHACWQNEMLALARQATNAVALCHTYAERIDQEARGRTGLDAIDLALLHQNRNPVKLITSGPEERSETPFEAAGRIRYERRVLWWNNYHDVFCVFGHYSVSDGASRGNESSFCIDYGVGKRWTERQAGKTNGFVWKLAALRYPERIVVFDDGSQSLEAAANGGSV